MKSMKNLGFAIVLIGSITLLATSCAPSMTSEQRIAYDNFISSMATMAQLSDVPTFTFEAAMIPVNVVLRSVKNNKLKLVDTGNGAKIKRGTSEASLKLRFQVRRV